MKRILLVTTAVLSLVAAASAQAGDAATTSIGVSFCFGDGTDGPCPCANPGLAGHGCENSAGTGGSLLVARGTADLCNGVDTLQLTATGEKPTATSVFMQGDIQISAVPYASGLRCIGSSGASQPLVRFGTQVAVAGTVTYPLTTNDCSVSQAVLPTNLGGCHGLPGDPTIACGKTRYYQVFYRDPVILGGCPATSTYNISNAVAVTW